MTFEAQETRLEGFPIRYTLDTVPHLNHAYGRKDLGHLSNPGIGKIARQVMPNSGRQMGGTTADGYDWFSSVQLNTNEGNIKVLFPWCQDFKHPESHMDRSIEILADRVMPLDVVKDLTEQLAYQMTLYKMEKVSNKDLM